MTKRKKGKEKEKNWELQESQVMPTENHQSNIHTIPNNNLFVFVFVEWWGGVNSNILQFFF